MAAMGRPRMAIKIDKPDRCDATNGSSEPTFTDAAFSMNVGKPRKLWERS
jgi:hypothetical protein